MPNVTPFWCLGGVNWEIPAKIKCVVSANLSWLVIMDQFVQEALANQQVAMPDGSVVKLEANISEDEGSLLHDLVLRYQPTRSIEVGCSFGISAHYICEAMQKVSGKEHIVVDSGQRLGVRWAGFYHLLQSGYGHLLTFHVARSQEVLPDLCAKGIRVDFAFIDGWHTFDHALVDFFQIDKMLNVGGIVAFDDADWPSIRKVCRFVETNRQYERIAEAGAVDGKNASLVAYRKLADDNVNTRRWDHYVDF